ncbi:MAG: DNA polymerase III subunit beta [Candidatus Marinimicrobia bacterium]|nr:DNA polymerase III subunit beta [Candidatus Neomarinimicrobiota bacterium]
MHFSAERAILNENIKKISKVVPSRTTMPILESILFTLEGDELQLRATDLNVSMKMVLEVDGIQDGTIAVPATILQQIVNQIDEDKIQLKSEEDGRVKIISKKGHYDINGRPAEEFPSIPVILNSNTIEINKEILNRMIRKSIIAVGRDELKPALLGVLCEVKRNEIKFVATDVHKFVAIKNTNFTSEDFEGSVIIPERFLSLLLGYLSGDGSLKIEIGENHIKVELDNYLIYSRLINEQYPDYESVIPYDNDKVAVIDTVEMSSTLKRVSIFSNQKTKQISLKIQKDKSIISTLSYENYSSAEEEVKIDYSAEDIELGFNAEYFIQLLDNIDTVNAVLKMDTPLSPNLLLPEEQLEDEELLMIIMPIRLENS